MYSKQGLKTFFARFIHVAQCVPYGSHIRDETSKRTQLKRNPKKQNENKKKRIERENGSHK